MTIPRRIFGYRTRTIVPVAALFVLFHIGLHWWVFVTATFLFVMYDYSLSIREDIRALREDLQDCKRTS
jgi:hypothetical protein